jgi:ABC-2 type transport system ATP-binding protein
VIPSEAIAVEQLVVTRNGRRVLDGLTFGVRPGEIVGLLGPNGAGKTTTLAVLATLLHPESGEVRVAGHDVRAAPRAVRAAIGRVPQEVAIYPTLTARENAVFFARMAGLRGAAAREAANDALERVGLHGRADERAAAYSGGMQRRLSLACGLLGLPPVLLLDEPTVGVDPQSLERIVTVIRSLATGGAALLYCTHNMVEAEQLCDRVVLVDRGRVVAGGTPAELIELSRLPPRVDVLTERELPPNWLGGLAGARALAAPAQNATVRGSPARVAIDALEIAPLVLERAAAAGGNVIEFHVQRPNLHDAFLAFTGSELRD